MHKVVCIWEPSYETLPDVSLQGPTPFVYMLALSINTAYNVAQIPNHYLYPSDYLSDVSTSQRKKNHLQSINIFHQNYLEPLKQGSYNWISYFKTKIHLYKESSI